MRIRLGYDRSNSVTDGELIGRWCHEVRNSFEIEEPIWAVYCDSS